MLLNELSLVLRNEGFGLEGKMIPSFCEAKHACRVLLLMRLGRTMKQKYLSFVSITGLSHCIIRT
jgi:hypothetical protein